MLLFNVISKKSKNYLMTKLKIFTFDLKSPFLYISIIVDGYWPLYTFPFDMPRTLSRIHKHTLVNSRVYLLFKIQRFIVSLVLLQIYVVFRVKLLDYSHTCLVYNFFLLDSFDLRAFNFQVTCQNLNVYVIKLISRMSYYLKKIN